LAIEGNDVFATILKGFLRQERGAISPLFVLMLIPICGVLAMAVELGNGALQQRTQQHAADSAALAAAIGNNQNCYDSTGKTSGTVSLSLSGATGGNCVTTSSGVLNAAYTPGYKLEARSVAASITSVNGSTVTPAMDYCPGTTTGNFDCYKVTISSTVPTFLAQVTGLRSLTPTAVAYSNTGSQHDDCFVGTGYDTTSGREFGPSKTGDAIYLNGNNNLGSCWAATAGGTVDCSGSVHFAGVASNNSSTCGAGYQKATYDDSARETAVAADIASLPTAATMSGASFCSIDINGPSTGASPKLKWTDGSLITGGTAGVEYAYFSPNKCNGSNTVTQMSADVTLSDSTTSKSRVLILDGTGLDVNGHNLIASSSAGTTIVATDSGGTTSSSLGTTYGSGGNAYNVILQSTANGGAVDIRAPTTGTFANYAIIGDPAYHGAGGVDDHKNNNEVNFSVLGIVFAPRSDVFLDASNNSYFNSVGTCMSIVANTIQGSGGKLSDALTTNCFALGYVTPTSLFSVIALVK
jgi:Flp pilus assembly protein TadG